MAHLKYKSATGHLMYGPHGHLSKSCFSTCGSCGTDTPESFTVSLSGLTACDCLGQKIAVGDVSGTWTLAAKGVTGTCAGGCEWSVTESWDGESNYYETTSPDCSLSGDYVTYNPYSIQLIACQLPTHIGLNVGVTYQRSDNPGTFKGLVAFNGSATMTTDCHGPFTLTSDYTSGSCSSSIRFYGGTAILTGNL
jgi:hypothetical protein